MKHAIVGLRELLNAQEPVVLEKLAGDLLGRLLDVVFSRARAGSQRGGDGGVLGVGGRHLIYEAKRLSKSDFDDRSLRGEIDEAAERDPALEAWILVSTRDVSEQTLTAMDSAGRTRGIHTMAIDWVPEGLPRLAALCASSPDLVEAVLGPDCRPLLDDIASAKECPSILDSIRNALAAPTVGYELLRRASHDRVRKVWSSASAANSFFGQDIAGGAAGRWHVQRPGPLADLDAWWRDSGGDRGQPALVVGREGVGKTWAVVDWLRGRLEDLPIVVLAPSRSMGGPITGRSALTAFIARCLGDLHPGPERDEAFWERRVTRLLGRPIGQGVVFTVFFDGLNEEPSYDWLAVLNQMQDEPFHGRVRVVATARESFVADRIPLGRAWEPRRIEVQTYDPTPGGELDRKLAAAGLAQDDLPRALLELARVPRLFDLVVRLRDRLGSVERVTVHRLLWEHGATALGTTAFSPRAWRGFLLDLAREFRSGGARQPRRRVEELGASAATPPDKVYTRVSSIVDGMFAQVSDVDEVEFKPEFVRHALGLALVHALTGKSAPQAKEVLEAFFEPINEHDEEAEITRAAVSIALARQMDGADAPLVGLCGWWVACQNLPEGHLEELAALAPEMLEPLLDAVEQSAGHAAASARYRAVNALSNVGRGDRSVARTIARRGATWLRRISRDDHLGGESASSRQAKTHERLESQVGTSELGEVTVLGHRVEIVATDDEGLAVAAAQLLQGRPLADAIDFLEAGALHLAITSKGHDEQPWLNILNDVDPAQTAAELRNRAGSLIQHRSEDQADAALRRRVAECLLWRTGYEEDAARALEINPRRGPWSYTEGYLVDPAKSVHGLERRHARDVLQRQDVPLRNRIDRARMFLADPSFEVPEIFGEEAVAAAQRLNIDNLAAGRSRTSEDLAWRDYSLVLARCAPAELARIERKWLRSCARREGEGQLGAALAGPNAMLLVGKPEREALQELRARVSDEHRGTEAAIRRSVLVAEIQGEEPAAQLRRITGAQLDAVDGALARASGGPSTQDLERVVAESRSDPHKLRMVAEAIGEKSVTLGRQAFEALTGLLFGGHDDVDLEPIWVILGLNAPERLGAALDAREWVWSTDKPYIESVMASTALAAANRDTPFSALAPRLAPVRLLPTLGDRESTPQDVALAVELLNAVVMPTQAALPETPLEVSHDCTAAAKTLNYLYTYGDIRETEESDSFELFFRGSGEEYEERRTELAKRYKREVLDARRRGASFHLEFVRPEHFSAVLDHCPEAVSHWLEGMEEKSSEFVSRVRLGDGFFVSLCEALLVRVPDTGLKLWRSLQECLTHVRFTVHDNMDRLQLALFGAGWTGRVEDALVQVYESAVNDAELVDLVVAARRSDRLDWLRRMVARDATSQCPADLRRCAFLEPLLAVPSIAGEDGWPEGELAGGVRGASWKLGQREAFGRYWLEAFAKADSAADAHAAWRLFLACVDRRAWSWMHRILDQHGGSDKTLEAVKERFVLQQIREVRRAMKDNERHWRDSFGHLRYPQSLQPWNR